MASSLAHASPLQQVSWESGLQFSFFYNPADKQTNQQVGAQT